MANEALRNAAKAANVYLWQIADALCISDNELSRRLRHDLPPKEQERVLSIIDNLRIRKENEH